MASSRPIDVFLSYSKADGAIAGALARAFEQSGISLWWDACLGPGEPFEEAVKTALLQTRLIVGIVSRESLQSPWVRWELARAHEQGLHVVPVVAGDLQRADLPAPLSELQTISLDLVSGPEAVHEAVDGVRSILAGLDSQATATDVAARRKVPRAALPSLGIEPATHSVASAADDAREYLCSNGFQEFLAAHGISIAFTAFPLGLVFSVGPGSSSNATLAVTHAPGVRTIHAGRGSLLLGCESSIERFAVIGGEGYAPQASHPTGSIDVHDLSFGAGDRILFVNTRYSCLSSLSSGGSVEMVWTPPFITRLAPEDRCHLNGVAVEDDQPAWATAAAATDVVDGWRTNRAGSGVVIDIARNRVVYRGLSMPHSPRLHDRRLWVLNSGAGELGVVSTDPSTEGRFEVNAFIPGFLRGLVFVGHYAIVGVSKARHGMFEGLPLFELLKEKRLPPWSGLAVIDTRIGKSIEWLRLTGRVWEVSDVAVLDGVS